RVNLALRPDNLRGDYSPWREAEGTRFLLRQNAARGRAAANVHHRAPPQCLKGLVPWHTTARQKRKLPFQSRRGRRDDFERRGRVRLGQETEERAAAGSRDCLADFLTEAPLPRLFRQPLPQ